jgi:hypothetical protein
MKVCTKCKTEKPITNFSFLITGKNGLHSQCKECKSLYTRNKYKEKYKFDIGFKARKKERQSKYYKENKDKIRKNIVRWNSDPKNRERKLLRQKLWVGNNIDHIREQAKGYYYKDEKRKVKQRVKKKKEIDDLSDQYILVIIRKKTGLLTNQIPNLGYAMESERELLKLKRAIKNGK